MIRERNGESLDNFGQGKSWEENRSMRRLVVTGVLTLVALALVAGCGGGAATVPSGERVFYLNAIEIKGGTDGISAPSTNPETLGKTFAYWPPGTVDSSKPNKWQVSSYQFNPSALTVFQGDRVKLVLFVVNGDVHKDRIEGPDGNIVVAEKEHNRGRQYEITFTASEAGIYQLICEEHKEAMRTLITVVPN